MNTLTEFKEIEPYLPVDLDVFHVGSQLAFDLYLKDVGTMKQALVRGTWFNAPLREGFLNKGVSKLYIKADDKTLFDRYYRQVSLLKESQKDRSFSFREYSYLKDRFLQINADLLIEGTEITFSLYNLCKITFSPVVEASVSAPVRLTAGMIADAGCDVLIKDKEIHLYQEYLAETLRIRSGRNAAKKQRKVSILREHAKIVLKEILDDPLSSLKYSTVESLAGDLTAEILQNEHVVHHLIAVRRHDFYSYVHSFNTAVLAAGLAAHIGLDKNAVHRILTGMMLHDVGKRTIPPYVLHKLGNLTDTEYALYKQHVVASGALLEKEKKVPKEALTIALQHHERLNGKGYPYKLSGAAISMQGRIAAIADAFDALTTPRPHKYPLSPFYALQLLAREAVYYDKDLLASFIKMLGDVE
jgi:HD-GYP domain-containing protein (c-di-GMP phosphodiesterase class II)